jgi:hypothetical protein
LFGFYFCHVSPASALCRQGLTFFGPADIVEVSELHACHIKINNGGRGSVDNGHHLFFRHTR